jgi:hypothetical protein
MAHIGKYGTIMGNSENSEIDPSMAYNLVSYKNDL